MSSPAEMKCLSPFAWRYGWLKGVAIIVLMMGVMAMLRSGAADRALPILVPLVLAFAAAYFWPSKLALLEDGLAYERYGLTRFIPYSKIQKTESLQRLISATSRKGDPRKTYNIFCALRIHLEGGKTLDIGTSSEELESLAISHWTIGDYGDYGAFDRRAWELKRELDARVEAAHEASTPMAVGLVRGEKSVAEWLTAIDAAAPAKGDAYRGAEGALEALWRVLEDAASPREARAAAALALRSHLDEDGKNRMRVVVDNCESPKLRVAIETALEVGTAEQEAEPRLLQALEEVSLPREES